MSAPIHVLWAFSSFALGGPQRRFLTLAAALGPQYRHSVFAMDGNYAAAEAADETIPLTLLNAGIEKGGFISRANIGVMRGLIDDCKPDVLATTNWGAIEWFMANRGRAALPHLHFEDGFGPDERPDAQNPKRVWMRRVLFRSRKAQFIAPSQVLSDVYETVWKVHPRRVSLIPNGVDCGAFSTGHRPVDHKVMIGTVAALRAEKRIDRLIDAFAKAKLSDAELMIVGDGPERASLEAQAQTLNIRAHFVGAQDDVAPFLRRMDVFAMSSDTEQMPISLVEAMAAGLPVVATDVGDTMRMVCVANTPFVAPLDAQILGNNMRDLASNPALRLELGDANAQKARAEYDLDTMVARYDAVFRNMVAGVSQSDKRHQTGT